MPTGITTLKEFMLQNSIEMFYVNDDPEGLSGDEGIFFDCAQMSFFDLIWSDEDDSIWDDFVQFVFDALGEASIEHPYARLTGYFFLENGELHFETENLYFKR